MLARTLACTICATVALAACDDGVGPPRATPPTPPAGGNDPDFAITGVDGWHVIGTALTPGSDALALAVDGRGEHVVVAYAAFVEHLGACLGIAQQTIGRF